MAEDRLESKRPRRLDIQRTYAMYDAKSSRRHQTPPGVTDSPGLSFTTFYEVKFSGLSPIFTNSPFPPSPIVSPMDGPDSSEIQRDQSTQTQDE